MSSDNIPTPFCFSEYNSAMTTNPEVINSAGQWAEMHMKSKNYSTDKVNLYYVEGLKNPPTPMALTT